MSLGAVFTNLLNKHQLFIWIALSVGGYALISNVVWHHRQPRAGYLSTSVKWIKRSSHRRWLERSALFLYYVGVPYAALLYGVTNARAMGITHLDWQRGVPWMLGIGVGGSILLAAGWWYYARRTVTSPTGHFPLINQLHTLAQPWGWTNLLLRVIYQEAHLAFYRSGWLWAGYAPLTGTLGGCALIIGEWATNPAWRQVWRVPRDALENWFTISLITLTSVVFALTNNLWLCLITHIVARLGILFLLQRAWFSGQ